MPTSVEIIAKYLQQAGVKYAYGIPGGEVVAMIDALENNDIQFTLVKHENAGGFMAEGAHHASGTPGVLVATLGPGVANAINFIANAHQDRVPVIFLTGCVDEVEAMTYTHQIFDHQVLLKPITKASLRVANGAVEETIDKAISIALQDPPGPVHVDIPISVATKIQNGRTVQKRVQPSFGVPSKAELELIGQYIQKATKPTALAGVGVLQQHAEQALNSFLKAHAIPLITTYKAKGILPEDHQLSLGGTGLSPKSESVLLPLVKQADLVLLFGYDPIEMRPGWRNVWDESTTVLEFGTLVNTHYMHQSTQHFYVDLNATLPLLDAPKCDRQGWLDEVARVRQANKIAFSSAEQWGPHAIISTARAILPDDTVATVDTGAHRILLSQMWACHQPRTLLQSTGLCTMGVAVPMALGYKMHKPEVPVVAFTGDAGMEMVLGDLATVRDSGLAIIIIIFVDESLALIELKQRTMKFENVGVDFKQTDFESIGNTYGFHSESIDNSSALEQALSSALDRNRTTLLACKFPRRAYDGAF